MPDNRLWEIVEKTKDLPREERIREVAKVVEKYGEKRARDEAENIVALEP